VAVRHFLVTVTANALRYGDEVVKVASSRAFDPATQPRRAIPLRPEDVILLAAVSLSSIILLRG